MLLKVLLTPDPYVEWPYCNKVWWNCIIAHVTVTVYCYTDSAGEDTNPPYYRGSEKSHTAGRWEMGILCIPSDTFSGVKQKSEIKYSKMLPKREDFIFLAQNLGKRERGKTGGSNMTNTNMLFFTYQLQYMWQPAGRGECRKWHRRIF